MTIVTDDIDAVIGDVLKDTRTVSIIGNGRNSGKTTALKTFLNHLEYVIGISSFGNDRTQTESVESGLIYVKKGTLCATSRNSLAFSDITKEILATTGINTPMGEIVIFRAISPGLVLLSGASTVEDSIRIRDMLRDFGADKVIFDGSVNRKSPASPKLSDSVTLTFAVAPDILWQISHEMGIFSLKTIDDEPINLSQGNFILFRDNELLESADIKTNISTHLTDVAVTFIGISGALQGSFVKMLAHLSDKHKKSLSNASLIIDDATKFFIQEAEHNQLKKLGIQIYVRDRININSIFINPIESGYSRSEIDNLLSSIDYGVPVFDIMGGVCFGRI